MQVPFFQFTGTLMTYAEIYNFSLTAVFEKFNILKARNKREQKQKYKRKNKFLVN